jgi:hypothetical protein
MSGTSRIGKDPGGESHHFSPKAPNSEAVIAIQRVARGFLARRKANAMHADPIYFAAKQLLADEKALRSQPRAQAGKSDVFLPTSFPIVLKSVSNPVAKARYRKSEQAEEILSELQLKRIALPEARVHGDWIVEQRLPITHWAGRAQLGFYLENENDMAPVVRDLTDFLLHSEFTDLVNGQGGPRYDNLPLFLDSGGKLIVGLVDLEHFSPTVNGELNIVSALEIVARFYPLHINTAFEVAAQYDVITSKLRERIGTYVQEATVRIEEYRAHVSFLESHGVGVTSPKKTITLTEEMSQSMAQSIIQQVEKHDDIKPRKGEVWTGEQKKYLQETLIPPLLEFVSVRLQSMINTEVPSDAPSMAHLIDSRTLGFDYGNDFLDGGEIEYDDRLSDKLRAALADQCREAVRPVRRMMDRHSLNPFMALVFSQLEAQGMVSKFVGSRAHMGVFHC